MKTGYLVIIIRINDELNDVNLRIERLCTDIALWVLGLVSKNSQNKASSVICTLKVMPKCHRWNELGISKKTYYRQLKALGW